MQIRRLIRGPTPLLISIPHMGTFLPPDIKGRMTDAALKLPDTDWSLDKLYWFAVDMGASLLMSAHSRYVVDLNRPPDDSHLYPGQEKAEPAAAPKLQGALELDLDKSWLKGGQKTTPQEPLPQYVKTGLCPLETFAGEKIYKAGEEPNAIEKLNRVTAYWVPYHETLAAELQRIKQEFGYAILYDAHSIKSVVPRLFSGQLPDLTLGSAHGTSCAPAMVEAAYKATSGHGYSSVVNGRFIGGYITRHYGQPQHNIHALQTELAQINYMDENYPYQYDGAKAEKLQGVLKNVLTALLDWGRKRK
ncbi:MAG: N-formylglutamate amidohydrolase [Proteobacteria bacterium]|nr:N-formylglutamate amidohydrolase [Pseudomonadota bacterium]